MPPWGTCQPGGPGGGGKMLHPGRPWKNLGLYLKNTFLTGIPSLLPSSPYSSLLFPESPLKENTSNQDFASGSASWGAQAKVSLIILGLHFLPLQNKRFLEDAEPHGLPWKEGDLPQPVRSSKEPPTLSNRAAPSCLLGFQMSSLFQRTHVLTC